MKKIATFCCYPIFLLAASMPLTAGAQTPTIKPGILQIGTDLSYPPYNYFDEKKLAAGFDVEFMTALAKAVQLKVRFIDTRFENLIIGIAGNKFDVIASTLYVKPERVRQVKFIPYMRTGVSIAVDSRRNQSFSTPEQLCGKRVSVIKGAAWIANLNLVSQRYCMGNGLSAIQVKEFPTSPEASQAVLASGVDAQVEDSAVLKAAVLKTAGRLTISSQENLFPVIVGLGLNPQNKALHDLLASGLTHLKSNGEYQQLLAKYNVSAPSEEEFTAATRYVPE